MSSIHRLLAAAFALSLLLGSHDAQALSTKPSPARFLGTKTESLATWRINAPTYPAAYGTFYSLSDLQSQQALGFNTVRFAFAPDPLIAAQVAGNTAAVDAYVAQIVTAGKLIRQAGLYVIYDMHFVTGTTYSCDVVTAAGTTTDPTFAAYRAVLVKLAAAISANHTPEEAAIEPFNEPPVSADAVWASMLQPNIYAAIRAVAPDITVILTGGDLGNVDALISTVYPINPSQYGRNVLYSFHEYNSAWFSNCDRQGAGIPTKYCVAAPWPSDGMDITAATNASESRVNADSTLDSATKAYLLNHTDSLGRSLFQTITNYATNLGYGWHVNEFQRVARWADLNGVDRSQLIEGEMGLYKDGTANSTSEASRVAWYTLNTSMMKAQNIRFGLWVGDYFGYPDFNIQNSGALPTIANTSAAVRASLLLN